MSSRVVTLSTFVLSSFILWYALDGFVLRGYAAAVPILFSLQVLMNDFIEQYLVTKLDATWFRLVIIPGTVLHELSHAAAAKLTGCTVTSASLAHLNPKGGELGSVEYEQPKDNFAVIRSVVVGFAPFFGCGVVLVALLNLTRSYFTSEMITPSIIGSGGLEAVLGSVYAIVFLFYQQFAHLAADPMIPLLLYLQVCVGLGAAASSVDLKGSASSLIEHPLGTLTLLLLIAAVFFASEQAAAQGYVVLVFQWAVFILLTSISLLIASVPVIFAGAAFMEVSWVGRLASLAAAVVVYLLFGGVLLSLAAFLLVLAVFRFSWVFVKSA